MPGEANLSDAKTCLRRGRVWGLLGFVFLVLVVVDHGEAFEFHVEPPQELRDLWFETSNEPLWPLLKTTPVFLK